MNKNIKTILATAAIACVTGCVTAGTWVNGYYVDGPLCTVCDGTRVVTHTYGTTVCAHCDGTGIEPPQETLVVENVIVDTWRPAPPPPRVRCRPAAHRPPPPRIHHRPAARRPNPPRPAGGGPRAARPTACPAHHAGGRGVRPPVRR